MDLLQRLTQRVHTAYYVNAGSFPEANSQLNHLKNDFFRLSINAGKTTMTAVAVTSWLATCYFTNGFSSVDVPGYPIFSEIWRASLIGMGLSATGLLACSIYRCAHDVINFSNLPINLIEQNKKILRSV